MIKRKISSVIKIDQECGNNQVIDIIYIMILISKQIININHI